MQRIMNTLARNFAYTFRRFFTASALNLIGLAIAFASFFIIMTQVDYDLNFNKGYKDYRNIYRAEVYPNDDNGWQTWMTRPLCELIATGSPHIRAVSIVSSFADTSDYEIDGHTFSETTLTGFGNFMETFQPDMIAGSADALEQRGQALISRSTALRFFGTIDAVGKTFFQGKQTQDNLPLTVGGVYEDFPENSQIGNWVFISLLPDENKDNWKNWNYNCYLRTDGTLDGAELNKAVVERMFELIPGLKEQTNSEEASDFLRFTPITDVHFSKVGNKSASSRTTVYLLLCVSFLIVFIAAINFTNFTLAETPMRVKSINTQKVLGATVRSLRIGLIAEAVLISLIAFAISVLLLLALRDSGIQDLVTADLDLRKHPILLASTLGISLLMGILAGAYPSWYVTSFPPALALKGSFGLSPKGRKLRTVLVCFQFFVTFILIIAIGIMYTQSRYIRTSDYGYDKDAIVIGSMASENRSQTDAIAGELSRISGVESVAFSQFVLSSSDGYMNWGRGSDEKHIQFDVLPVDYRYLKTLGIRITEGRDFKPGDGDVYIFNEAAWKKYPWMTVDQPATPGDYPVVGFCENVKYSTFRNDNNALPMAFFIYGEHYADWGRWENFVNVRIAAGTDKVAIIRSLQKAMEKFAPGHDFNFCFMDQVLDNAYRNELRFTRQILLFSLLAILISMIGVFGLTMFESEYRRKEIGIRKIFGSTTGEILRMFNRRYLYILMGCFVVAAPFGWWIGKHWLEGFAERTPIHAWIFLMSFLLVTAITMLTVTVQSWKNANENPANSIKTE